MNTARACTILTCLTLTLNACTSAPVESDALPIEDEPKPIDVPLELFEGGPHLSFDAFAQSVGSSDSKEEAIMMGSAGEGSATGFITTGGLIARDGVTQRVLLAGRPGALYEVAVLDSWASSPDFFPYAAARLRGEDLPPGYFELAYDFGRTKEVADGGTSYDHHSRALICKDVDARFACATFVVAEGAYVEPAEGTTDYEIPNAMVIGREDQADLVEVMTITPGDTLTPSGTYRLVSP